MAQEVISFIVGQVEKAPRKRYLMAKNGPVCKSALTDHVCTALAERGLTVRIFKDNKSGPFAQVWKGCQDDMEKFASARPRVVYAAVDFFTFVTKALQHRDDITIMLKDGRTEEDMKDVDPDSIVSICHRDSFTPELRQRLTSSGFDIMRTLEGAKIATVHKKRIVNVTVNLYRLLRSLDAMDLSTLAIIMAIIKRDEVEGFVKYSLVPKHVGCPNPHIIEFLTFKGYATWTATCVEEHIQMVIFHDGQFQDLKPFGSCEYVCTRPCEIPTGN